MDLTISDLSCFRGEQPVITGLSATVPRGTTLILRGPNGSGKSTLLRALAGLLPLAGGDVRIGDVSLRADRDSYQEHLTYAGHLDANKSAFTVRENLTFWANLFGDGNIGPALARFDLEDIAERRAAACSAGQKRRLGLARILVADRPVWLLDEPTVSLDVESASAFSARIGEHCASGGSAIVATHIDLGLPDANELRLSRPDRNVRAETDPFLAGGWT